MRTGPLEPLQLSRSRTYPVERSEAFDRVLSTPLPGLFCHRYGPIPPIKEVRDQDGEWGTVGQTRTIRLADGGSMRETLTSVERPTAFSYRIADVAGPMRPLIREVAGTWRFEAVGTGVRITWSWAIAPTSAVAARLLPVVGRFWQGYARSALGEIESLLVPGA